MILSELSETEIISRFQPLLPFGNYTELGPGDDCALVAAPGGRFVVTTDILVEGQHFRTDWSTGYEVGARAAAQNLADIAAMGATATSIVVSLVLPKTLELDWLLDLVSGMAKEVEPTGAGIVGGDLTTGDQLVISVTAHGVCAGLPILRSGARPGDTLAIAGTLGRSAAGHAALQRGAVGASLHGPEVPYPFTEPVSIYRAPRPPLSAGPLAAKRGATAMLDVSDGLAIDAGRLADASNVHVNVLLSGLAPDLLALSEVGQQLGVDPLQWVLHGGEDHGLLATFPPYVLVTDPFRTIGSIGARSTGEARVTLEGKPIGGGWDHFAR